MSYNLTLFFRTFSPCIENKKKLNKVSASETANKTSKWATVVLLKTTSKDLKIEDGSCQRRLPEVILSLEKLVRMSEPVDNGVLDL